jgi:hypothetical protein
MNTPTRPVRWNTTGSREVHTVARPRWRQLRQGLLLVVLGQIMLYACVGIAAAFLGPWSDDVVSYLRVAREDVPIYGWGLGGGGALLGYLLLLLGQWRCLVYAPQGNAAKELQYAALTGALTVPLVFALARYLGGKEAFAALADLDFFCLGAIMPILSLVTSVLYLLLLSAFARAVRCCLRDEKATRRAGYFFWFVGFLVGGTVGVVLQVRYNGGGTELVLALVLGWLLGLLWHLVLIVGTARGVARALKKQNSREVPTTRASSERQAGQVTLQTAASFRESF